MPQRLGAITVDSTTISAATTFILERARTRSGGYVCIVNAFSVSLARSNERLRDSLAGAALVVPDGVPVVWALKHLGDKHAERVYGPDLMLEVLRATADQQVRHFFLGGCEGAGAQLAQRLAARFQTVEVAGWYEPPFTPLEDHDWRHYARLINHAKADIAWFGLGAPKQECLMARIAPLTNAVLVGVGQAFSIHAGLAPACPRWLADRGLEWLFRLKNEPGRLWRRYLVHNPRFLLTWAQEWQRRKQQCAF